MSNTANNDILVRLWAASKKRLARLKVSEMKLRKDVEAKYFSNVSKGTTRIPFNNEQDLKCQLSETTSLNYDEEKTQAFWATLTEEQQLAFASMFVSAMHLDKDVYNALDNDLKLLFDKSGMVSIKRGLPQIDIVTTLKEG